MAIELNHETITTPPRPAASVVLLRDDPAQGLQVLLLRRHARSNVLAGAYVFPGGKLDEADADPSVMARLDQSSQALHQALAEPELEAAQACGLFVAALREMVEEAGVLLALHGSAVAVDLARVRGLLREGVPFAQMLTQLDLRLDTRAVVPWSRWITPRTPSVMSKRFDTRFFVAQVPADQEAQHDDHETTESVWLTPRTALQRYWAGEIDFAPPQIMSLSYLARHERVASVMEEARGRGPVLIEPEPFAHEDGRLLTYPGDERHSVREQRLPGLTRLVYRNQRFEPMDGRFEAFFE